MALGLHNLKPAKGSKQRVRRLGRGHGSGRGTTAGRGTKGQRARAGGRGGLKLLGLKQMMRSKPKIGGFQSLRPKLAVVNVSVLEERFASGEKVNRQRLHALGLVTRVAPGVKILGEGTLTKKLTVEADAFSATAKKAIEAAGGQAIVVAATKKAKPAA